MIPSELLNMIVSTVIVSELINTYSIEIFDVKSPANSCSFFETSLRSAHPPKHLAFNKEIYSHKFISQVITLSYSEWNCRPVNFNPFLLSMLLLHWRIRNLKCVVKWKMSFFVVQNVKKKIRIKLSSSNTRWWVTRIIPPLPIGTCPQTRPYFARQLYRLLILKQLFHTHILRTFLHTKSTSWLFLIKK